MVASAAARVAAPALAVPQSPVGDGFNAGGSDDGCHGRITVPPAPTPVPPVPSRKEADTQQPEVVTAPSQVMNPPTGSGSNVAATAPCVSPPPRGAALTAAAAQLPPPPPIKPVVLTFSDVSYSVSTKAGEKQLLRNVFGFACPGTVTALCGASGAGKTTLLDGQCLTIACPVTVPGAR